MSIKQQPNKKWAVVWRDENLVPRTRTTDYGRKGENEAKALDLAIKAAKKRKEATSVFAADRGKKRKQEAVAKTGPAYLDGIAQAWVNHLKANGKDGPWLKDVVSLLNNHWLKKLAVRPVDDLSYKDMVEFISAYKDHSQSTRNRYLSYLRTIFKFGIKHKMASNNPLEGWRRAKEPYRDTRLTVEDLAKILTHAKPHLKWSLILAFYTGIRPGPKELFALTWNDVDFKNRMIHVHKGKGNRERWVTISNELLPLLVQKKAEAKTNYLVEYKGSTIKQIRRALATACRKARITYPVCMYDARHLFATMAISEGGDLKAVSMLLGHSNTDITANRYYHLLKGQKEKAVELLPALEQNAPPKQEKNCLKCQFYFIANMGESLVNTERVFTKLHLFM